MHRFVNGIAIGIVAHMKDADSSVVPQNVKDNLPLLAARCVALGIGLGVTLLAITRIAETENHE